MPFGNYGDNGIPIGCLGSPLIRGSILGGPPHPVIVTIRDNKDYIRVFLYSYYMTITGWGVLLSSIGE